MHGNAVRMGNLSICHCAQLNQRPCAIRGGCILYEQTLGGAWSQHCSADASAERIDSCTLSMSRSRAYNYRPSLAWYWPRGLIPVASVSSARSTCAYLLVVRTLGERCQAVMSHLGILARRRLNVNMYTLVMISAKSATFACGKGKMSCAEVGCIESRIHCQNACRY